VVRREPIDPVRYIGNRSSGKMGYALAEAAAARGATVTLVSGPSALPTPTHVTYVPIETVEQLRTALHSRLSQTDVLIQAAAVSDYRVATVAGAKIKRDGGELVLRLVETPDIIGEIGALPQHPLLVGFAAETGDLHRQRPGKTPAQEPRHQCPERRDRARQWFRRRYEPGNDPQSHGSAGGPALALKARRGRCAAGSRADLDR